MAHDAERLSGIVSRRRSVMASGTAGVAALVECSGEASEPGDTPQSGDEIAEGRRVEDRTTGRFG